MVICGIVLASYVQVSCCTSLIHKLFSFHTVTAVQDGFNLISKASDSREGDPWITEVNVVR